MGHTTYCHAYTNLTVKIFKMYEIAYEKRSLRGNSKKLHLKVSEIRL